MNENRPRVSDPDTPNNPFGLPIEIAPAGALPDDTVLLVSRVGTDEHGRARISAVKINDLSGDAPPAPAGPPQLSLANALRDTTANLAAYIEQRAQEIAAPRIAEVERDAAERVAAAEGERDANARRFHDVEKEFRRQYANIEKRRDELAWLVRYLPPALRVFVTLRNTTGRHLYPAPPESFAVAVDQAAAELGLTPYAEES
ncbi:hypothetical protein ABZ671_18670 [Micromonospora sp. NPDC006766]|uniref:hypothetical protein n=1 Tax=Micromonospora sp. NPDC006766 TaxID=3154778 RepID=UPI0033D82044